MPRRADDPTAGERVLLNGTGSRWGGGAFRATVYDVRKEDKTVKVQYDDGGFKRFSREEFDTLLLGAELDFSVLRSSRWTGRVRSKNAASRYSNSAWGEKELWYDDCLERKNRPS